MGRIVKSFIFLIAKKRSILFEDFTKVSPTISSTLQNNIETNKSIRADPEYEHRKENIKQT